MTQKKYKQRYYKQYLPEALFKALDKVQKQTGRTRQSIVRQAIATHLLDNYRDLIDG